MILFLSVNKDESPFEIRLIKFHLGKMKLEAWESSKKSLAGL